MSKEGQGTESLGFLDSKGFESPNVAKSSLQTEIYYVRFHVLTAASMKITVLWDIGRSLPLFQRCFLPLSSGRFRIWSNGGL
jgi:hypothetical protein